MWIIAIFSYLFNKAVTTLFFLGSMFSKSSVFMNKRHVPTENYAWRSVTREIIKSKVGFFLFCLFNPKTNCHNTLTNLGPFKAEEKIGIDTTTLSSALSWNITIFDQKFNTITHSNMNDSGSWQEFDVPPGYYTAVLRYYGNNLDMYTPAVFVDGHILAEAKLFKNERKLYHETLESIRGKISFPYFLMQYYAFFLLKHRKLFPEKWVVQALRPVQNPETVYFQGYLNKGSYIQVCCEPELLNKALVFIATYNLCAFPETWTEIQQQDFSFRDIKHSGAYMIRVVSKQGFRLSLEEVEKLLKIDSPHT